MTEKQVVVSLGHGLRLINEAQLYEQFRPFGLSKRSFRAWMANMHVPYVEIGRTRLYNVNSVLFALTAITRVGQPNFLTPGCHSLKKRREAANTTRTLDPGYYTKNWKLILSDLIANRRMSGLKVTRKVIATIERAADMMTTALLQMEPLSRQKAYDQQITQQALDDGVLEPLRLDDASEDPQ